MLQTQEFLSDLRYIENDTVAQQGNGLYCKWSIPAGTVTRTSFSKEQYFNFFLRRYLDRIYMVKDKEKKQKYIDEDISLIKETVDELFGKKLISLSEMINKIKTSKETQDEKDKILKEIRRETNE